MVFDFLPQPLDMDVYGAGIPNILIAPNLVKKLFPRKYLVGGGGKEIQKL